MPGVSAGTTNIEYLWYGGASGSVIAITMMKDAIEANDENHFSPLMIQWSPSRVAVVAKTFGSAPPCGSVMEKHDTMRLSSSGSRYRFFSSGVP
jgi:hypothetical protein